MSLLLYAITDASEGRLGGAGVEDRPLMEISAAGLQAVVSEHEGSPELDESTAWRFEQVIEAQMEAGPALPVRFGSLVSDPDGVRRLLEARQAELREGLRRVRGAVELSVSGAWTSPPAEPDAAETQTGADYLRRRARDQSLARARADELRQAVQGLVSADRIRLLPRPRLAFSAALLVPRERVSQVATVVDDLSLADVELVCTGPWPPYSFVGKEDADA